MAEEKTDKDKVAVALEYERGKDEAPRVTAKGKGRIAEKIIEIAREHGITVKEDANLVEVLAKIDIDTIIPLEAYAAVAEILNFVYRTNSKAKRAKRAQK